MRLHWVLENLPIVRNEINKNNVLFGTLETWLVYKLTGGKTFITDATNASATGFFDPFVHEWSEWALHLFKLPKEILPPVVNNDHDFGCISEEFFGCPIRIECVVNNYYLLWCLKNFEIKKNLLLPLCRFLIKAPQCLVLVVLKATILK